MINPCRATTPTPAIAIPWETTFLNRNSSHNRAAKLEAVGQLEYLLELQVFHQTPARVPSGSRHQPIKCPKSTYTPVAVVLLVFKGIKKYYFGS